MSMALDRLCLMPLLAKLAAMELSSWIGVAGFGWPISSSAVRSGSPFCMLLKRPQISASAADAMTFFSTSEVLRMGPLKISGLEFVSLPK